MESQSPSPSQQRSNLIALFDQPSPSVVTPSPAPQPPQQEKITIKFPEEFYVELVKNILKLKNNTNPIAKVNLDKELESLFAYANTNEDLKNSILKMFNSQQIDNNDLEAGGKIMEQYPGYGKLLGAISAISPPPEQKQRPWRGGGALTNGIKCFGWFVGSVIGCAAAAIISLPFSCNSQECRDIYSMIGLNQNVVFGYLCYPFVENFVSELTGNKFVVPKTGGKSVRKSLDKCTVKELKERATKRGVKISGLKKAEIIAKLRK